MGPSPVTDSNFCSLSFILHQNFFVLKSINGKIYIFSIQNNFRFQKNFLNAMKNFLGARFQLFLSKTSSYNFFQKITEIRLKIFSKSFLAKMRKKIWPGLPR